MWPVGRATLVDLVVSIDHRIGVDPFRLGSQQRVEGRALEECPFPIGSADSAHWRRGWLIANTSARMRSSTNTDDVPKKPGKPID